MTDLRHVNWPDLLAGLNAGQHLAVEAVVAYVDGELGAGAHERATAHLAACASCASDVAAQRQARSAVRAAAEPALPSGLLAALRSIPQTAELGSSPEGLAVTSDGTVVSTAAPLGSTPPLGSTRPLGSRAPVASRSRLSRQGAGTVVSGLVLGALIMVTPGGTRFPEPSVPAPAAAPSADPVRGSAPAQEVRFERDTVRERAAEAPATGAVRFR